MGAGTSKQEWKACVLTPLALAAYASACNCGPLTTTKQQLRPAKRVPRCPRDPAIQPRGTLRPPCDRPQVSLGGAGTAADLALAQTDASRAKLVEQHIQARVSEELRRLQRLESDTLRAAHERIASRAPDDDDTSPSRHTVSKEVEELRRKLEQRKQLRALPKDVESARSDVVRCLRENDRRPLDCWQEVERFKSEVKKLEKGWVDRVIS